MSKVSWRAMPLSALLIACFLMAHLRAVSGDEWQPVTQEELKMTSLPEAPGAPAVVLYKQVDKDDGPNSHEYTYVRIKVLTEEGRKYANVQIPFVKQYENIASVRARTIRPDGSIANFDGKVFEQTIVKAKGIKFLAKTLTLPDVQVGSIIEYHYTNDFEYVFDSKWVLSDELFTRRAKFSLKPNSNYSIRWSWPQGLPTGTNPPKQEGQTIKLETQNVPAFQVEDYMPPENELKYRVDFIYGEDTVMEKDPAKFWKQEGKKQFDATESFANKKKAMEQIVSQLISPSDAPEVKLQKIYARVQQVRNTSFEKEKTEQELKREKQKEINNVEDLWKRGYGDGRQVTWLYLALVRAAGFEAYPVLVSRRSDYFFKASVMNPHQLNDNVVLVKVNGQDKYFDPGTAFTPFGYLPWSETSVGGLKLTKDGGEWVTTPLPPSEASRVERKADLKLTTEGSLEGKLAITYVGLDALWMRIDERNDDDTTRRKLLEDMVKETVPVGIEVELTNKPDWTSSAPNLVAEFTLKVPGWVSGAGKRALMPVGLFSASEKHLFEHQARTYAVYFHYPYKKVDDINIELPLGWKLSSLPAAQNQDAKAAAYVLSMEDNKGTVHISRTLRSDLMMVDKPNYPILQSFFQAVRTGDEEQVVLQPGAGSASN